MPAHPFDHLATEVRKTKGDLTERELVRAMLAGMSDEQKQQFYSDSCYYYESREGPYDWLIGRAQDWGVIFWDFASWRWKLGPLGSQYGRTVYRRRLNPQGASHGM